MAHLPLANLTHHRVRSILSATGIGVGVCMMITLAGLSRGSVNEVVRRWRRVRADLIVAPGATNITMATGAAVPLAAAERVRELPGPAGAPLAERVTPVFVARVGLGAREHSVFGVAAEDFDVFSGGGGLIEGRLPDPDGAFGRWIRGRFEQAGEGVLEISDAELAEAGGLEVAVDTVLADELDLQVGQTLRFADRPWRVVGIYQAGATARVIAPIEATQFVFGLSLSRVTLLFVDLTEGASLSDAAGAIEQATRLRPVPIERYQDMLMANLGVMYHYVDAVNALALTNAFLFIMVTLYTMVLQRRRDIAILKSMGAGRGYLLRQILSESLLLTAAGAAIGVALSFVAGRLVEWLRPDLAVSITARWVLIAVAAAAVGGLLAGPAWIASRVEVAEALREE
jgi:ABC-type antimicrobial peptide transport system permease subunit